MGSKPGPVDLCIGSEKKNASRPVRVKGKYNKKSNLQYKILKVLKLREKNTTLSGAQDAVAACSV